MSDFESTLNKILSSPEDMEKIAEIAKSFSSSLGGETAAESQEAASPLSMLGSLDPKLLATLGKLIGEYSGKNEKNALIEALSPYLKEEQRGKLAKATDIAKLARVARIAFKEFDIGGKLGV